MTIGLPIVTDFEVCEVIGQVPRQFAAHADDVIGGRGDDQGDFQTATLPAMCGCDS